ncbi:hypothetical protein SVAN01_04974 [Stagonosporopsis vannaccii]|nr:hypothetical protein SVAN01_04974 [Stagonosporopsis vannaccii]
MATASVTSPPPPWHSAYPAPRNTPATIRREDVLNMIKQSAETSSRDYVLVDLRRNDHEGGTIRDSINLPAQSLYPTIPTLYTLFKDAGLSSSKGRGNRAAGWFADYIADQGDDQMKSLALAEGVKGWATAGDEYVQWMMEYDAKSNDMLFPTHIRNNQRRSRTRRRELINDLQSRVQEFELRGVAAAQGIQRAARKVAEENSRLRSLLARHSVSREEADSYLGSFAGASTPYLVATLGAPIHRRGGASERVLNPTFGAGSSSCHAQHAGHDSYGDYNNKDHPFVQEQKSTPTTQQPETEGLQPLRLEELRPSSSRSSENYNDTPRNCRADNTVYASPIAEQTECPNTHNCFCAPATGSRDRLVNTNLEISCKAAAAIIAEMRGDGDTDVARASLGWW